MQKAAPKRKKNGYKMPDPLPKGEKMLDTQKREWILGTSVGKGGFGEIYSAKEGGSKSADYPYVIKIEPHANGPLFVEMHFYTRNCKQADIDAFKKSKNLKNLGMPAYIASGSHEYQGEKYRFIVMERFLDDLNKLYLDNGKIFPNTTIFKVALQMIDVYEYIHGKGYVHGDLKGANILLSSKDKNQTYLVDFGIAGKFSKDETFKPDAKKMHDGTIEYVSRDAHKGVQTRRGDLEVLVYNMIQWLGCTLPWQAILDKLPHHVSQEKYRCFKDDDFKVFMDCLKHTTCADDIVTFLKYINSLEFNEEPDYDKVRDILKKALQNCGGSLTSPLVFTSTKRKSTSNENVIPSKKAKGKQNGTNKTKDIKEDEEELDEVIAIKKGRGRGRAKVTESTENGKLETEENEKTTPKKRLGRSKLLEIKEAEALKEPNKKTGKKTPQKKVGRSPKVVKRTPKKAPKKNDSDIVSDSGDEEVLPVSRRALKRV